MKNKFIIGGLFLISLCTIIVQYVEIRKKNKTIDIIVEERNNAFKANNLFLNAVNESMELIIYTHKNGAFNAMDSLQIVYLNKQKDIITNHADSGIIILDKLIENNKSK